MVAYRRPRRRLQGRGLRPARLQLEHFWNFDFGLGAITVVEVRAGRAALRALNLDSHLGAEANPETAETSGREASGAL